MNFVVIGNGVAGITAARQIRKQDDKARILVISSESRFFYSRTALMYIFMGDLDHRDTEPYERRFYRESRIELLFDTVENIDTEKNLVQCKSQKDIPYDKLLITTGSKPRMLDWPGRDLKGVVNFYSLQDLENLQDLAKEAKQAVIIGGGLIGIEMVEILLKRNIQVTFLIREKSYFPQALSKEESDMVVVHMKDHGVQVIFEDELARIEGKDGKASAVITKRGRTLPCQVASIAIGVAPNVDFLRNTDLNIDRGILVNEHLETSIKDIYAAGDCTELSWKDPKIPGRVEQIWYTAKMQGEIAGRNMTGENLTYDRGIWYNCAKFFEIDYHTFGHVNFHYPGEENYYYRVPGKNKSLRIVHCGNKVIGFNLLGMRFRDEVCRQWIREKKSLDYVLARIEKAWFEPEFAPRELREVIRA